MAFYTVYNFLCVCNLILGWEAVAYMTGDKGAFLCKNKVNRNESVERRRESQNGWE